MIVSNKMSIKGLMLSEKASLKRLKTITDRMSLCGRLEKVTLMTGGRSVVVIS